jgi:hypothetical protein
MISPWKGFEEYARIEKLVNGLSYKPDWNFQLHSLIQEDIFEIEIIARVPDVTKRNEVPNPFPDFAIHSRVAFSIQNPDHIILMRLRSAIQEMEFHEVDEWFRLNGEPVTDPHLEDTGLFQNPDLVKKA